MAARQLPSEGDLDHDPSIPIFSKNVADIGEVEDTPVFQERVAYLEVRTSPRGEALLVCMQWLGMTVVFSGSH